ncbi:hypothetical protein BASA81_006348 [Batrachochytrium salamandrivorans]|nr:hypothetical protein BASA81_006348 [Batrachochytrium salamandrivorans]
MVRQPVDAALDVFDRLCFKCVETRLFDTAADFLARFQSTAASLEPNEMLKLMMTCQVASNIEFLKAVLVDPQASKVGSLFWEYNGKEDVNSIIPLLTNNCPELAFLGMQFARHSAFNFVSKILEHPCTKLKVLEMPPYSEGDLARLFAALGQSQVSALTISSDGSPEFAQGLCEYLVKDLLVRLELRNYQQAPPEPVASLANCTRLDKLEIKRCYVSQPTSFTDFPKSITKLVLYDCTFVDGFDWSFLTDNNVQELDLHDVRGAGGNQLGSALAVHLRTKGLDKLRICDYGFANETLTAVGVELGRIKRLEIDGNVNDASIELIALVLQSPNSELRELVLECTGPTMSSVENHLVPALKHPNCNLAELSLGTYHPEHKATAFGVIGTFRNRRALFALLQGQQVRRLRSPLRRLPVDLLRLVGKVLI